MCSLFNTVQISESDSDRKKASRWVTVFKDIHEREREDKEYMQTYIAKI